MRQKSLAADLSFVLDQLTEMNQASEKAAPFTGRLDLSRVGALGHSDGGTAAGLACQLDQRIQVCASENGWTPQGPNPKIASVPVPSRPFLWINMPLSPPENEQLAYLHMRRSEFDRLASKSAILAEQELKALPNGAYRVIVRLPDVTDSYFTDGPFVWSLLGPQRGVTERNVLVIVNSYVRAFFDYHLRNRRGAPNQLLDGSVRPLPNVEVQRYGSPRVTRRRTGAGGPHASNPARFA